MQPFHQLLLTTALPCWVIGHRGAAAICPENTLPSFRMACAAGACMIEFDVQQSADGELVVFHDETLNRLCGESSAVGALSWDELATKVVGHWHGASLTMPRLIDVFSTLWRSLLYNIELKTNVVRYPGIEERLVRLVHDHAVAERVLISSFQPESLRVVQELDHNLPLGLLIGLEQGARLTSARALVEGAQALGCFSLHPDFRLLRLYPELVDHCHSVGLRVFPWTVDHPDVWKTLVHKLGVDGVITNDPGNLYEWLLEKDKRDFQLNVPTKKD
jgi:glycerophosphoryl diester phosphodiesterase